MSIINSQPLIGASGNQSTAYNLTRSLRFRSSASAYLNRTIGTPTSGSTWTISFWMKRGAISSSNYMYLFSYDNTASNGIAIASTAATTDAIYAYNATAGVTYGTTARLLRDPSSWYHIVFSCNAGTGTLYVNNQQQLTISSMPSMTNGMGMNIGRLGNGNQYFFDGYLTETNFIDGQALTPSSFGETDTATGVWKPKKYTGTYGTNGFYLKFDNLTSTSTLGNDSSGNSNTWTVNNISLTSGATYDSMKDVPTLTDADTANYCTLNPLQVTAADEGTSSDGNLSWSCAGGATYGKIYSTMAIPSTGKYYWEVTAGATGNLDIGIISASDQTTYYPGYSATGYVYYQNNGNKVNNNTYTAYGASYTTNDVIGVAFDATAGTLTFYKNNTSQGTAFTGLTGTYVATLGNESGSVTTSAKINFGQQPFAYTPPSGYKALNTFNLPTPTIGATASTQANKYFDIKTYTGTGSSLNITGLGFQPDLVWIKERNAAADHALYDAVRGVQKQLESNTTTAETTETTGLTAFNSDGFTVGGLAQVNTNTDTYVAWAWDANGAGSSNTAGSITSTVSANTTAGFSIVTYTGTGSTGTVGHGLGVAPSMVIIKGRSTTLDWRVWHTSLAATYDIQLNTTAAAAAASAVYPSAPTSTVINIGSGTAVNTSSSGYVAYCFAEVAGYSKFGSYTGNGSTDGTFVFTGFAPAFILIKRTDTTGNWIMLDDKRYGYNSSVSPRELYANLSNAEADSGAADILSNGFKLRITGTSYNASGGTYVFMALAENPFKYSLGR